MTTSLLFFLLLASPAQATVYCGEPLGQRRNACKPEPTERKMVMDSIDSALSKQKAWDDARVAEGEARAAIEEAERRKQPIPRKALVDWQASLTLVNDTEGEMRRAFSDVMKATQETYGVGPKKRVGQVKGGRLDGEPAFWTPIVQETDDFVYRAGPAKNPAYLRWQAAADDGTATMDDGTVFISIRLLQDAKTRGSPAVLAAALDHEAARFEQLVSKDGWTGAAFVKYSAYDRQERTGAAIDLDDGEMRRVAKLGRKYAALAEPHQWWPGYRAGPASEDYPYRKDKELDDNVDVWKDAQKHLATIRKQREDFNTRLAARHEGDPEDGMRDSLNEDRHPCGGQGWWAGDIFFPSLPCEGTVRPSPETPPALPAEPPTVVRPVQPPSPARPLYLLTELAARICEDPSSARSDANHEFFRHALALSGETGDALPACQREVYLNLRRVQREGYGDYDSQFFQSLAERLNNPSVPEQTDTPGQSTPTGPRVPDCILQPGGRCAHHN
ncbi:hypothetical protein EPO15_03210 [bacterium]|nr:MAG: hypothetical protein EPO15_03210 [bacterium]